jgi:hypothetical protein
MSTDRRDAYLEPASVVAAVIYSLLLASGLVAHGMGFPKSSTEPRATSSIAIDVRAPLFAAEDETIGYL